MQVEQFEFPTVEKDGVKAVEEKVVELVLQYRDHAVIPPEALDWLDWANNALQKI
jgi:hypothetical protein